MNKRRNTIFLGCAAGALVLIVGGNLVGNWLQKQTWISQQVYTVAMDAAREKAYLNILKAAKVSNGDDTENGLTLYSTIYYPEASTVMATLTLPDYEDPVFYLVLADGQTVKGWYMPSLIKFGITRVAFENLTSEEFVSLDILSGKEVAANGYDPALDTPNRTRFPLFRPNVTTFSTISGIDELSSAAAAVSASSS